jgi:hypothetical protein
MTRDDIVAEARRWIGTPYRQKGRSARGLDCLGLLVMLGRAFDIAHVDAQDYSNWPREDLLVLRVLATHLTPLPIQTERLAGCIGAFAERRLPGHVGVFSEQAGVVHLIHARTAPPMVVEEAWPNIRRTELRLIGLFALPGMVP